MQKNNNRLNRTAEELKKIISHIISFEVNDPKLTGLISITKVKITPDLKYARVYITILNSKNEKETMQAIKRANGFIRSRVAESLNMRVTPEIIFEIDDSTVQGMRIDSIIKEISKNESRKGE